MTVAGRRIPLSPVGIFSLLALSGCYTEPGADIEENREAPLYGDLTTKSCNSAQGALLGSGHRLGKLIAPTGEYGACVARRMAYEYKPCLSPSDPFLNQSRPVQTQNALTIMRASNTADVEVTCANLGGGTSGDAHVDGYGDSFEQIRAGTGFLDGKLANGVGDFERADVAGLIWHEAMHQQGYQHSGDTDFCGYPTGQYARGFNSVPYFADRCMRSAGIHSRLYATSTTGFAQSFGLGRHRATQGDFVQVADNQMANLRLGPATRASFCTDDPSSGTGSGCTTAENLTTEYGDLTTVPAGISFLEVEPRLLVYRGTNYGDVMQAFGYGEFRANLGDFATIGNDTIRSIYVPPGMRVRACFHEGGTAGHGIAPCATYDGPVPDLGSMSGNISYLEVEPAVTAFTEANGFGTRQTFGRGVFVGPLGGLGAVGDNRMVSIVIPQGIFAQVCSDYAGYGQGGGNCRILNKTNFNLNPSGPSDVSYLLVGPHLGDTLPLSVAKSGGGSVTSLPYGIDCGSTCTANFYRRSTVRLTATPPSGYDTTWTGCDSTVGTTCTVSLMSARSVSVAFTPKPNPPPSCYSNCLSSCLAFGGLHSQCVPSCRAQCQSGPFDHAIDVSTLQTLSIAR